jgi:hypothetical protein
MKTNREIGKSVGDRFAIKFRKLEFIMMSHEFCMPVIQVR